MEQKVKILEKFLESYNIEGICGFWVDKNYNDETPVVYIIIDIDWIKEIQTKPEFVAKRIRIGVKEDIKKWLGIDVHTGSIARKCDEKNPS